MENILGTGHPNIFLQKDFGEPGAGWVVRVETLVPIEDSQRQQIEGWLALPRSNELAELLVSRVPADPKGSNAKHMIAAAFGFEWNGTAVVEPEST